MAADETRTDPSRGYKVNPQAYDQHKSGGMQRASSKADDFIKSRTPQERRAEREFRDHQRLQQTMKGKDGVQVFKGNVIAADPNEVGAGGKVKLTWVTMTIFYNGALATCEVPVRNITPV